MTINSYTDTPQESVITKAILLRVSDRRAEDVKHHIRAPKSDVMQLSNGNGHTYSAYGEPAVVFTITCQWLVKYRTDILPRPPALMRLSAELENTDLKNNNNNKKNKPSTKKSKSSNKKKGSLGRTLLTAGLGGLGGLMGPVGAKIGSSLGDWGANLLGMGDYKVEENTLLSGNGVPSMHDSGTRSMRVKHREFLGDITGSTAFTTRSYTIQPGSSQSFPWLSRMAELFQSYRIHGMVYTFNSTSADALNSVNTALGTVIMSTQYNVSLPPFTSKAEMEQYEYTVAGRPSRNLTHIIECDPKLQVMDHLFCRSGTLPVGQDYQFYDWGTFQFATVGMQAAATIGELWVSYDIEFFKPRIQSGGSWPGDFTFIRNGPYVANGSVLGTLQTNPIGNLGITVTSSTGAAFDRISWPEYITSGRYIVTLFWRGNVSAAITYPTPSYTNLSVITQNTLSGVGVFAPDTTTVANRAISQIIVSVNGYASGGSHITFGLAGVLPATPVEVSVSVVAIPLSDINF